MLPVIKRILSSTLCGIAVVSPLQAALQTVDLLCEYSVNPLGVDIRQPRLFWRVESDEQGQRQTAWQVLVSSTPEKLSAGEGDLWDSGKVASGASTHVPYEGRELKSSQEVYWKVRAWDANDEAGQWSEPAKWTMGRLHTSEWKGEWICAPNRSESVLLRHEFNVEKELKRAVIHVSGLGQYELFLNGERVGERLLAPGWTAYDKTTLYNTYDITRHLNQGGNAVGALLGNGMYHVERRNRFAKFEGSFGPKRLVADIVLEFSDGTSRTIGTSGEWKTHDGPITYSSIYGGEDYDARRLPSGWDEPGFEAETWDSAVPVVTEDVDTLRGHSVSAHPIQEIEVRDPVEVRSLAGPGSFLYDFGQNTSYMPRLTVTGPKGSIVRMVPGELVYPDGYVTRSSMGGIHRGFSWWEYVKATNDPETWFPSFFYIGSRYLQVTAIPAEKRRKPPVIQSLQGVIVHSSARPLGEFRTSNPLLNDIRDLVRWAQRSNMVSVLTDCPHREKLGWLEQYHLNGPSLRYEFDVAKIYTKGMNDMADSQTWEGLVPNIAPEYTEFGGTFRAAAEWGAAFIVVPWQQYLFSGDTTLIRKHYKAMRLYFNYLETRAEGNILSEGLGDWYDLGPRAPGRAQLTKPPLTATAFFYYDARLLSKMAALIGEDADSRLYARRAEEIRTSFNKVFYNKEGYYGENSQAANAIPLYMGIVAEENRGKVMDNLVRNVVDNNYTMTAGDVGFRFLIQALSDGGHDNIVYRMINHRRNPGYGYQLKMGATALTESWSASRNSSNNHFMLGHITEWFYQDLLGIQPVEKAPGFRTVRIHPGPVEDLDWVEGSYDSLHGPIKVRWEQTLEAFSLAVTLPPNTTGEIWIPARNLDSLQESGKPVSENEHLEYLRKEGARIVLQAASGKYTFTVEK